MSTRNACKARLEKLSEFGRNPEGGVTRIGYSETDMAAREYVMELMKSAALEVRIDAAGNIFGRRAGTEKLPVLLFGSHIDSVKHGGNFDGDVGSMGGIEVIRAMNDGKVKTRHPLEVVIWTNEEGNHFGLGTLGSGVAAGLLGPEILERKDEQGLTLGPWDSRFSVGVRNTPIAPSSSCVFHCTDLAGVHVKLLRELRQRLVTLESGQSHLRLVRRRMIPSWPFHCRAFVGQLRRPSEQVLHLKTSPNFRDHFYISTRPKKSCQAIALG